MLSALRGRMSSGKALRSVCPLANSLGYEAGRTPGVFTHFETHELIQVGDLTAIAERAKGITYQPPGA